MLYGISKNIQSKGNNRWFFLSLLMENLSLDCLFPSRILFHEARRQVYVKIRNRSAVFPRLQYQLLCYWLLTAALYLSVFVPPLCFSLMCKFSATSALYRLLHRGYGQENYLSSLLAGLRTRFCAWPPVNCACYSNNSWISFHLLILLRPVLKDGQVACCCPWV